MCSAQVEPQLCTWLFVIQYLCLNNKENIYSDPDFLKCVGFDSERHQSIQQFVISEANGMRIHLVFHSVQPQMQQILMSIFISSPCRAVKIIYSLYQPTLFITDEKLVVWCNYRLICCAAWRRHALKRKHTQGYGQCRLKVKFRNSL